MQRQAGDKLHEDKNGIKLLFGAKICKRESPWVRKINTHKCVIQMFPNT